jgi:hypothetical protein
VRRARDQIIIRAYIDTNALAHPCPTCGADTNEWCSTLVGNIRRVPCVSRATTGQRAHATAAQAGRAKAPAGAQRPALVSWHGDFIVTDDKPIMAHRREQQ